MPPSFLPDCSVGVVDVTTAVLCNNNTIQGATGFRSFVKGHTYTSKGNAAGRGEVVGFGGGRGLRGGGGSAQGWVTMVCGFVG